MLQKNYNVSAYQGITDLEVCRLMGVDTRIANTEEINTVCIEKVYQQNLSSAKRAGLKSGMSIPDAENYAKNEAEQGKIETLARLDARLKATGKNYIEL